MNEEYKNKNAFNNNINNNNNNNGSDDEQPSNRFFATKLNKNAALGQRPNKLILSQNLNYVNNNNRENASNHLSSPEDNNSPTQLSNCRKLIDKAPLVKRLSNSLLRGHDEYQPLLNDNDNLRSNRNYLFGSSTRINGSKINDTPAITANECSLYDANEMIASRFGESCRKSLTSVLLDNRRTKEYCEFDSKQIFLRETSSANSSPKMFPFTIKHKRARGLSTIEQVELRDEPWFQIGVPRDIALEVLRRKCPGDFLVRESTTKPGCFALSLRAPPPAPKVVHYLILKTSRGYKIKGCAKEFATLKALITHHSVMPEQLPVPLALPRPKHLQAQRRNVDDFETYSSLNDFKDLIIQT